MYNKIIIGIIHIIIISMVMLSCSDCENGIDANCLKECSDQRKKDISNCDKTYGPEGINDPASFEKCKKDTENNYSECRSGCPCAD